MDYCSNGPMVAEHPEYKAGVRQMLKELDPAFFVTLNFNRSDMSFELAKAKLGKFYAALDQKLLGKHWASKPPCERTSFIAMPEIKGGKLHYHLLLKTSVLIDPELVKDSVGWLKDLVKSTFRKAHIAPAGSTDVQFIDNLDGVISYVTKDVHHSESVSNYVLSSEFLRS